MWYFSPVFDIRTGTDEGREKNLWIGTIGGGLTRLKEGPFTTISKQEGLSNNSVRALCEGMDGSIWVGTENGLNRYKDGRLTIYTKGDGLAGNNIRILCSDREGNIWIANMEGGVTRFKDGRFQVFTSKDGFPEDIVTAMYAANDGSLWLSAPPRIDRSREIPALIFRYKDGKPASYSLAEASLKFFVTAMAEDRNGVMWFGSPDGKLSTFSDSTFKPYRVQGMQSDLFLTGIYPDKDGLIWISGLGTAGLIRIQDGKATVHPGANGSLKGDLYSVLEDNIGNLWLNCSQGILSFSKKEIAHSTAGESSTLDPRIYGVADGMKSAKCYFIYGESPLKSADGRIWFPTQRGVAVVDPAHMRINEIEPAVMIEEVVVGSEPIDLDRPIDLTPGSGTIQFRYSALSYTAVERAHFKYMLLGFDKD